MQPIWLKNYPEGVPATIDTTQYASVVALMDESFKAFSARTAYACMDKTLTFADVDAASRSLAAWLQSKGLKRGDRVAIMMPNVLQYPISVAGILRAGMTVVNVNPLYTPRELEHQLKDSGAAAIIILENFATTLEQVIAKTAVKHVVVAAMGDMLGFPKGLVVNTVVRKVKKMVPAYALTGSTSFKSVLAAGKSLTFNKPEIGPDDVAFLQYTGGTTGVSKGATLLQRNVVANMLQNEAWLQPALRVGKKVDDIVIVTALPMYHIFALTVCCAGARVACACLCPIHGTCRAS
jgi:long-chain acyl-CoA synthetase